MVPDHVTRPRTLALTIVVLLATVTATAGPAAAHNPACHQVAGADGPHYDDDPNTNPAARRYATLSYLDVLNGDLKVMDATAISLCMGRSMPVHVFDVFQPGALERLLAGEPVGTRIASDVETRFA